MKLSKIDLAAAVLASCAGAIPAYAQHRPTVTAPRVAQQSAQEAPRRANQRDDAGSTAPAAAPAAPAAATSARFGYEFTQPQFTISRVQIEHDAEGRGRLTFARRGDETEFSEQVQLSPAALARARELWAQLDLLRGAGDLQAAKQFPHLGTVRLSVTDDAGARRAEFNWTETRAAADLAKEYRRLADQNLFVFDIEVARANQPLEAPALLKRLETLHRRNELSDPAQLLPLLRDLATDERLPLIARNQADKLAKKIAK